MDFRGILVVFFLAFIGFAATQDEEDHEQDKIYFRINKKKVEITFGRLGKSGKKRDLSKGGFKIGLYKLGQTDGRGKDVGRPLQSFGNQVFSTSPFNKSAELQGVKAATIKLMAYLKDHNASISLRIFIFREEGNLTFGDESFAVQKGTIKFFIKVKGFPFCDGRRNDSLCKKSETGEYFEAAIVIKTRKGEKGKIESDEDKKKREGPPQGNEKKFGLRCLKGKKCPEIYRFGNNDVGVATKAEVDGAFKPMPNGYPKFMEQGGNQRFVFRGPRFNISIVFDPVVDLEEDDDDEDGDDDDKDRASSIHLNVFLLFAVLAALFM